jgi:hypothetical protein
MGHPGVGAGLPTSGVKLPDMGHPGLGAVGTLG